MSFFQAIFLGIVQGLTEFLPVSSSGHLVIFQKIFGFAEAPIAFDALVHFGTLIAILIFFRKEILNILRNKKLILNLIIGTIPIVFIGFLLKDRIEEIFNSLLLVGFSFLITATILFLASRKKETKKEIKEMKKLDSLIVGLFQALAILPGISRSGSTISGAIFRDIKKQDAFNFSFFLGMIAISGAMVLQISDIKNFSGDEIVNGFFGFLFAAVVGYFSLKALKKVVIRGKLHYFGIYCAVLGSICILSSLFLLKGDKEFKDIDFYNENVKIAGISAEIADDCKEVARGFMFREELDEDKGMLFIFSGEDKRDFWMKNTLIPLDIIFLDSDKKIVSITKNAEPCREDQCPLYNSEKAAQYVIEVRGEFCSKYNIDKKTKVEF